MSSLVFRAVRDSVPNPVSQERLVGAVLEVLAIADVSSMTCGFNVLISCYWDRLPSMLPIQPKRKGFTRFRVVSALPSRTLDCPRRSVGTLILGTQ